MNTNLTATDKKKLELIRLKHTLQKKLDECFDSNNLDSRPQGAQIDMLHDDKHKYIFVVCANRTGKSQTGARAISWWLQNKHPYIPKREAWGDSFNILVVGRTTTIMTEELWENKIEKFLPSGSYHVKKGSSGVENVTFKETKNKLIFLSHHDAKNAREKVQGFTTPIVWLDEMPDDPSLVTELMARVLTNDGIFIATFTPLVENEGVKKIADSQLPSKVKYIFRPEDNPAINKDMPAYEAELKAICATEAEYRARRFGEWYYSSGRVIRAYDPTENKREVPDYYNPYGWRHVAVVDPSASGLTGFTLWGEDPKSNKWYNVHAETIQGEAAFTLVKDIEDRLRGFNVVERICDCNPAGFYREAHRQGIMYAAFTEKMDRKSLLIDGLNSALLNDTIVLTPASAALEEEFFNCKWNENNPDKIVHSSKWHLIDTAQYFVDRMPKPEVKARIFKTDKHAIKQAYMDQEEKKAEAIRQKRAIAQKKQKYSISARQGKFGRRKGGMGVRVL